MRRWGVRFVWLGLITLGLLLFPKESLAINQNKAEDPAPNTASVEIEKAIAKGKELTGITNYYWGGGHGGITTSQYNGSPPQLDCSSFVHWAYNKGAGMMLSKQVLNTTGYKNTFGQYKVSVPTEKDAKRGDLVYLNGGSHIVIWLGDNVFLGMQGNPGKNGVDLKGGAQISTTKGWKWDGVAIRLTKDSAGVLSGDMEPLKDPSSVTGKQTLTESADGSVFQAFNPFVTIEPKSSTKGVIRGDEVISQDASLAVNTWVQKLYKALLVVALVFSAGLVTYTSIAVLWYFAILPRNGVRGMDMFEKVTGITAVYGKANTIDVLARWGLSIALIGVLVSKAYVWIMVGIYELIISLLG